MLIANETKEDNNNKKADDNRKVRFRSIAIVCSFFVGCIRHQMKYNASADECVTQLPQWFDRKIVCSNEIG